MKKLTYKLFFFLIVFYNIKSQNTIQNIENSTIIIRLNTNEHLINYHLNNNAIEKANSIKKKQHKKKALLFFIIHL